MAVVAFSLLTVVIMLCLRRDVTIRLELFESVRVQIDARAQRCCPARATAAAEADPLPELEIS